MLHSFRNHFFKVCCLYFKTNQCAASSKNNKLRQSLEVRMLLNILAKLFSLCKLNFYFIISNISVFVKNRVYQIVGTILIGYGGLVLGLSKFLAVDQLFPQKMLKT